MELIFAGEVFEWRGPSPYFFVRVPSEESAQLHAAKSMVTYGWGMIPVEANVGTTSWTTSLFARGDAYVVPLKDAVRRAEQVSAGDEISLRLIVKL